MDTNDQLTKFQKLLGYTFKNQDLLGQALRHRSLALPSNERLEFLGDALLGAIAAEQLYRALPKVSEGELSRCRIALVSGENLASLAERFGIDKLLQFATTDLCREELTTRHRALLADAMEAIIGAIFLDSDWENTKAVVIAWLHDKLSQAQNLNIKDPKTRLQEKLQKVRLNLPEYSLINATGPENAKTFEVACKVRLPKQELLFKGTGQSKRAAEQLAASAAIKKLDDLLKSGI